MTEAGGVLGLILAAAIVGASHTALGPDHTLPFVMLSRAHRWSRARTLVVTAACGLGHVSAALALVGLGLAVGALLSRIPQYRAWLDGFESMRGSLAGWGFVAVGGAYALWGVRRAVRRRGDWSAHDHDGHVHIHRRGSHGHGHGHGHGAVDASRATFWMLFALLVLGPCEPLIALFLPLAATGRWGLMASVGIVFSLATVATMVALVAVAHAGLERLPLGRLERWSHAVAGAVIAASGLGVLFLGL